MAWSTFILNENQRAN